MLDSTPRHQDFLSLPDGRTDLRLTPLSYSIGWWLSPAPAPATRGVLAPNAVDCSQMQWIAPRSMRWRGSNPLRTASARRSLPIDRRTPDARRHSSGLSR
jgi:hypothetical protein